MSIVVETKGIVLKRKPLGEEDILVTFLSPSLGLKKAIAPGAKKHKSPLTGKTELLLENNFLLVKGRSLDKIKEIETEQSYPLLRANIGKLAASQYLAEVVLHLALSDQPQEELYNLFREHLRRLENLKSQDWLFPHIAQAIYHLLALSGIAPEVYTCVFTQKTINPNFDKSRWRVGFSFAAGGVISSMNQQTFYTVDEELNALELALLQTLPQPFIPAKFLHADDLLLKRSWQKIERLLKDYLQWYLGVKILSADVVADILIGF